MIEQCRVREVEFLAQESGALVHAVRDDGSREEWQARFVVDASGRDTFLANRFKTKLRNPKHNSSALYGHLRGARRHPARTRGNIPFSGSNTAGSGFIPLWTGPPAWAP
ncbi:hypothetical protein ACU4GD_10835 [Cupriavidus basilensis]